MRYLFILLVLCGCTTKRLIKKLERRAGVTDTITVVMVDTVERFVVDTIHTVSFHDTVTVVNNERVKLKYFYDTTRQEIWHDVECKETVINKTIPVPIKRIKYPTWWENIKSVWWLILLVIILLFKDKIAGTIKNNYEKFR
jgi:hypothetical protein